MNTRRQFLKCCSSAVLGGTALPALGAVVPKSLSRSMPKDFAAFAGLLNQKFVLIPDSGAAVEVRLTRAELYQPAHRPDATAADNFNLHFTARDGRTLEEGTYVFRNSTCGELHLFVVPHKTAGNDTDYVATFHGSAVTA